MPDTSDDGRHFLDLEEKLGKCQQVKANYRTQNYNLSQENIRLRKVKKERDNYKQALIDLLREAGPYASMSKHLEHECENAQKILEGKE